jgi:Putative  PD-(D/E)XK family member, (DUF4420)
MQSIFNIFQKLKEQISSENNGFIIAPLPLVKNHKIGISAIGLPLFFIKCDDSTTVKNLDYNLEFISVQFNQECQLLSNNKQIAKNFYTVISLKTDSVDLQEYFLEVVYFIIKKISPSPKLNNLKIEVEKLIILFSKFSKPAKKTIQGLWAELLIIEQSKNPSYLIQAWHHSIFDKFDFNDGIDKIEVKSTSKTKRIHTFSIEQLNPNKNSNLVIASVFAVETGIGKSIFNLIKLINKKVKNNDIVFRINEVIAETLGKDFEKTFEIFFDYKLAIDSLAFYESKSIPKIEGSNIKQEISNVHFDSDLSNIEKLKCSNIKSLLHESLINIKR